jgi:hypothetical protein
MCMRWLNDSESPTWKPSAERLSTTNQAALFDRRFFDALAGSNTTRIVIPVALAKRSKVERLGFAAPLSKRAIVDCDVPIRGR